MPSKGAGFPLPKLGEDWKGQSGWGHLLPSKTSPAFRAKSPWGLAIRIGKAWTVAFVPFLFRWPDSDKPSGSGMPGRASLCCGWAEQPCYSRGTSGGKLTAFPRTPALPPVLLQANPHHIISPDNIVISRDFPKRTHNPLYDFMTPIIIPSKTTLGGEGKS